MIIKKIKYRIPFAGEFDSYTILLYIILFAALAVRIINLNYNSPFNDEAIYVVIGRLGLFANDWWSYGASLWMAGLPYIYPPMSALAYELFGVLGSRFLNVLMGVIVVEEIFRFVKLLNLFDKKTNQVAALIAASFVAFSGIGIFVSKLATYDLPSFLLFLLGINSFLKAAHFSNGKYYFLTFLFLFSAFLTKITIAIFFPLLLVLALLMLRSRSDSEKKLAIKYLFIPFGLASLLYAFFYWGNLMVYIQTHRHLGIAENYDSLIDLIWQETYILLLLAIPNGFLLAAKRFKEALALLALAMAIPVFHLALLRFSTLDKHLFLTVIFLSVIVGYGIALAFRDLSGRKLAALKVGLVVIAFFYMVNAYQILQIRQNDWTDSSWATNYLAVRMKPGDKLLTEEGGAAILGVYDKTFPPKNIVTFDWINYSGLQGERGYLQAIKDKYFDYIELNGRYEGAYSLRRKVRETMGGNYSLIYARANYTVYAKNN